jgi:4-methyl-5(b-hydroxyethyl)-thiazole monophosphate biosynthesis
MQIYLFLADGFEEIEAIAAIDIFRRAEIELTTVSMSDDLVVSGAHEVRIFADALFSDVQFNNDSFFYLPGGLPGTTNLANHKGLISLIQNHSSQGGKIAAICAAPSILGKMNLLNGKEAICYPGFETALTGARISKLEIVKSGNIFTAKAAGLAIQFALDIVSELKGELIANQIKDSIYY